jgi:hypothetical protein
MRPGARGTLDEHLHQAACRAGFGLARAEQRQAILHRAARKARDAQAHFEHVGEARQREEVCRRTDHEAGQFAVTQVQFGLFDEEGLNGSLEEAVHGGTGEVAVEVVVLGAGEDRVEMGEVR